MQQPSWRTCHTGLHRPSQPQVEQTLTSLPMDRLLILLPRRQSLESEQRQSTLDHCEPDIPETVLRLTAAAHLLGQQLAELTKSVF